MLHLDTFLNGAMNVKQDSSKLCFSRPKDVVKIITCHDDNSTKYDWRCILNRCNTCNPENDMWFD